MLSVDEWRPYLETWSAEWLSTAEPFPEDVRRRGWLGFDPASSTEIAQLERRLGFALPPTYRAFLLATNGWRKTTSLIQGVRPAERVQWLEVEDPQLLDVWCSHNDTPYADTPSDVYFAYDQRPIFDTDHFRRGLIIADGMPGFSDLYLLNPGLVSADGEWEAWDFSNQTPGAERWPSFAHLMRHQYEVFRLTVLMDKTQKRTLGPFEGIYAPDVPRHAAVRLGPGESRPQRPTLREFISKLEDPSEDIRNHAVNHLFRRYEKDVSDSERPHLVEQLTRILQSGLETEVRQTAAYLLSHYGDENAVPALIGALDDQSVSDGASDALFRLGREIKDTRIADVACHLLKSPDDERRADSALFVLEQYGDPRLATIGLDILDTATDDKRRRTGAYAVALAGGDGADKLIARLKHEDAGVRVVAAWALGVMGDKRAVEPLRIALDDPDPEVRGAAASSLKRC